MTSGDSERDGAAAVEAVFGAAFGPVAVARHHRRPAHHLQQRRDRPPAPLRQCPGAALPTPRPTAPERAAADEPPLPGDAGRLAHFVGRSHKARLLVNRRTASESACVSYFLLLAFTAIVA